MNLVDSSAGLEYFADGPNASFFATAIQKSRELIVPTVVILEVYKRILQQRNARAAIGDRRRASPRTHHRPNSNTGNCRRITQSFRKIADSIILATARAENAIIWTQ
jgi:hypothetical protein